MEEAGGVQTQRKVLSALVEVPVLVAHHSARPDGAQRGDHTLAGGKGPLPLKLQQ